MATRRPAKKGASEQKSAEKEQSRTRPEAKRVAGEVDPVFGWVFGPGTTRYDRWLLTQAQLAKELSMTPRQIQNLEERGLPHEGFRATKAYPWPDVFVWFLAYQRRLAARTITPEKVEFIDARVARAEHELGNAKEAAAFGAKERRMYGRELTADETVALGERNQYMRGPKYLAALVAGKPRPAIDDGYDYDDED